jgi:hypothetical protein
MERESAEPYDLKPIASGVHMDSKMSHVMPQSLYMRAVVSHCNCWGKNRKMRRICKCAGTRVIFPKGRDPQVRIIVAAILCQLADSIESVLL